MSEVEWGTMPPSPTARVSYDTALELVSPDGPTFIFTGDVPNVPVPLIGVTLRRQREAHNRRGVPEPLALCGAEPGPRRVGQQGPGMGVVESFSAACRSKGRRWAAFGLADRDPSQLGFVGQPTADRCRARGSFAARFARPLSAHDESQRFGVRFLGVWDTVSSVGWILGPGEVLYTA